MNSQNNLIKQQNFDQCFLTNVLDVYREFICKAKVTESQNGDE